MKETSEKMVEQSIKSLLATVAQNQQDVSAILDLYENNHDELECSTGKNYLALVKAHNALVEIKDELFNAVM